MLSKGSPSLALIVAFIAALFSPRQTAVAAERQDLPECAGYSHRLLIPSGYDSGSPDVPADGSPLEVGYWFKVVQLKQVVEDKSEVSLHLEIFIYWNDTRLISVENCLGELEDDSKEAIWRPDPYVFSATDIELVKLLRGVSEALARGPHDGFFEWWLESFFTLQCKFELALYPFDKQLCKFRLTSVAFPISSVVFRTWRLDDDTKDIQQDLGFEVSYLNLTHPNDLIYHNNEADDEDGAFSANGFAIVLKRNIFTSMVNVFIPSLFMVVSSSVSFWIPPDSVPGRMGLLVTAYLVLTNMGISGKPFSTRVFTAMDAWLYMCKIMVICAVLEFAWLLMLRRNAESATMPKDGEAKTWSVRELPNGVLTSHVPASVQENCRRIDRRTFVAFTAIYVSFTILYFIICYSQRYTY